MKQRTFVWFVVAAVVIVVVALVQGSHGGGLLHDWLMQLHGR